MICSKCPDIYLQPFPYNVQNVILVQGFTKICANAHGSTVYKLKIEFVQS